MKVGQRARRATALTALALCTAWPGAATPSDDPHLEPGRDPGGFAVAILANGFDYTKPALAAVLARDGEGEAIAWDAVDEDARPFEADGHGTHEALAVAAHGGVRIVQVRIARSDRASLARGIAFAVQTPAKIVFLPHTAQDAEGRTILTAAAKKFAHVLFVRESGKPDNGDPEHDAANLLILAPDARERSPASRIAHALGCGRDTLDGTSGADLRSALLRRLEEPPPAPCESETDGKREHQR